MKELSPRLLRVIDEIKEERLSRAQADGALGDLWAEVTDVIQGGEEVVQELCRSEDRVMAFGDWHECVPFLLGLRSSPSLVATTVMPRAALTCRRTLQRQHGLYRGAVRP